MVVTVQLQAQFVTPDDATMIANKYIQKVIDRFGNWAGVSGATAMYAKDLRLDGKLIGYYSDVVPTGFVVMSLRREFSPVKANSDKWTFNPNVVGGLAELIKIKMADHIRAVEEKYGPVETASTAEIESVLEFSCRGAWNELAAYVPGSITDVMPLVGNYNEGDILVTSAWDQNPPYNNECPNLGCSNDNGRALVGCVATAGAMIMRYWAWPPGNYQSPGDTYEWWNMRNEVEDTDPPEQQAAVAEISSDFGLQVGMNYGCDESGAYHSNVPPVYIQNTYNADCELVNREDYTPAGWWSIIKANININQPTHYGVYKHSIICDGWRFDTWPNWEYHMNYGHALISENTWYAFDQLPPYNIPAEDMIINIRPYNSLGSNLGGTFFAGYHYVNMDASGSNAIFFGGCLIQTLPNMVVKGVGTTPALKFYGTASNNTYFYTNGDHTAGIKIVNGGLVLSNNGSLKMYMPED
jgi:hypothetical protein